jgi:hypothetical protein
LVIKKGINVFHAYKNSSKIDKELEKGVKTEDIIEIFFSKRRSQLETKKVKEQLTRHDYLLNPYRSFASGYLQCEEQIRRTILLSLNLQVPLASGLHDSLSILHPPRSTTGDGRSVPFCGRSFI